MSQQYVDADLAGQEAWCGTTRRRTLAHGLECMAWAGAGVLWTLSGGVPRSTLIGAAQAAEPAVTNRTAPVRADQR